MYVHKLTTTTPTYATTTLTTTTNSSTATSTKLLLLLLLLLTSTTTTTTISSTRVAVVFGLIGVAMTLNSLVTFFQDCFVNVSNKYSTSSLPSQSSIINGQQYQYQSSMNDFTTTASTATADTDIEKYVTVSKILGSAYYLILTALILKACDAIVHALIPVIASTDGDDDDADKNDQGGEAGDSGNIKDGKESSSMSSSTIVYVDDVKIINEKVPSAPSVITMNPIVAEMVNPAGSIYDDL